MGLDQPVPVQYVDFLGRAVHGDFGTSFRNRTAALPLVVSRLPMTLALMAAALVFAMLVAVPLGIVAALFHRQVPDFIARFVALVGQSVAAPWLGVMLILLFAVNLRWLPSSGAASPQSIILPADRRRRVLGRRASRDCCVPACSKSWPTTTCAPRAPRACPPAWWSSRHALKNASIPVVAFLGIQIAFLFGNTVIAEAIFAYPGHEPPGRRRHLRPRHARHSGLRAAGRRAGRPGQPDRRSDVCMARSAHSISLSRIDPSRAARGSASASRGPSPCARRIAWTRPPPSA